MQLCGNNISTLIIQSEIMKGIGAYTVCPIFEVACCTVCPGSSDPLYIVTYYILCVQ